MLTGIAAGIAVELGAQGVVKLLRWYHGRLREKKVKQHQLKEKPLKSKGDKQEIKELGHEIHDFRKIIKDLDHIKDDEAKRQHALALLQRLQDSPDIKPPSKVDAIMRRIVGEMDDASSDEAKRWGDVNKQEKRIFKLEKDEEDHDQHGNQLALAA